MKQRHLNKIWCAIPRLYHKFNTIYYNFCYRIWAFISSKDWLQCPLIIKFSCWKVLQLATKSVSDSLDDSDYQYMQFPKLPWYQKSMGKCVNYNVYCLKLTCMIPSWILEENKAILSFFFFFFTWRHKLVCHWNHSGSLCQTLSLARLEIRDHMTLYCWTKFSKPLVTAYKQSRSTPWKTGEAIV